MEQQQQTSPENVDSNYESLQNLLQNEKTLGYGSFGAKQRKKSKTKVYLSVDGNNTNFFKKQRIRNKLLEK